MRADVATRCQRFQLPRAAPIAPRPLCSIALRSLPDSCFFGFVEGQFPAGAERQLTSGFVLFNQLFSTFACRPRITFVVHLAAPGSVNRCAHDGAHRVIKEPRDNACCPETIFLDGVRMPGWDSPASIPRAEACGLYPPHGRHSG